MSPCPIADPPLALLGEVGVKLKITPGEWLFKLTPAGRYQVRDSIKRNPLCLVAGDNEPFSATNVLAISRVPEMLAFIETAIRESDEWEALTEETWDKGHALLEGLVEEEK